MLIQNGGDYVAHEGYRHQKTKAYGHLDWTQRRRVRRLSDFEYLERWMTNVIVSSWEQGLHPVLIII